MNLCYRHVTLSTSGMRLKDFDLAETIGQNGFSRKLMAKLKGGDSKKQRAVVSELNLGLLLDQPGKTAETLTKSMVELINAELKGLTALNHPNVVEIHNAFLEKDCVFFVAEYYDEGSLQRVIQMRSGKMVPEPFPEPQVLDWFTQLSRGLQFLHHREFIHGGINAKSVFFTANLKNIKLGHCGIVRIIERTGNLSKRPISNGAYMAPEIWDSKPYTRKSDIWSLGVLLYQIMSLKLPFEATRDIDLFYKITATTKPAVPFAFSAETIRLVENMLSLDPKQRPLIAEVVIDLEGALTARPFQTVYWWNLKPPMRTSSSFNHSSKLPQRQPWLKTPSPVVDMLIYRSEHDLVLVICKGGEILGLKNQFGDDAAKVKWQGKVYVPRTVNNGETSLAHASVHPTRGEIFFTINAPSEGIFTAEIAAIVKSPSVELKRFDKGYASILESDRLFNGLVVDLENQAILCCDQSRKKTIGVYSVLDGRIHSEITLPNAAENAFRPFKVCLYPVCLEGKRCQLLGVCDSPNSKLHLFVLRKAKSGVMGLVEAQFLRTIANGGTMVGNVYQPAGVFFDPDGHLLVADAGNNRIQIFSADLPNEAVKGVLWDAFTTNTGGAFGEPISVVSILDEILGRPIILAGLHRDKEVLVFK